jgi:D-alanyl-lipoteichoic acid acyltransferase DltB (MBOAT superfamily)
LSPGWIPGRKVDNSDQQYASFRNNIPILFSVLVLHFVLRRGFNAVYAWVSPSPPKNSSYFAAHNLNRRKIFDIIFAIIFLTALHSLNIIKILFILLVNFSISYFHPSSILVPVFTWVFNIGVLFANEYFKGYRFRDILPFFIAGEGEGVGHAMDHFMGGGILKRWEILFNITVLRLISYNLDHYWAAVRLEEGETEEGSVLEVGRLTPQGEDADLERRGNADDPRLDEGVDSREERLIINAGLKKKKADPAHLNEHDRIDTPAKVEDYSLLNYLAYTLYTPLYLAGPILSFNDFIHQVCVGILHMILHGIAKSITA